MEPALATPGSHGLPDWWEGLPLGPAARSPTPGLPRRGTGSSASWPDRWPTTTATATSRPWPAPRASRPTCASAASTPHRAVAARAGAGAERMRTELAWREFYADVLWHRPDSARAPLLEFGARLRWDTDERARERFAAWATGTTGYPLVDAGMRQLLAEGWMHNRVRMVTASFLVKDLHIDWRLGARWFMWHLVDGDLASNQHGWQWVAGHGHRRRPVPPGAQPSRQQERFDPTGRLRRPLPTCARHPPTRPEAVLMQSVPASVPWSTTRPSGTRHWPASPRHAAEPECHQGRLRPSHQRPVAANPVRSAPTGASASTGAVASATASPAGPQTGRAGATFCPFPVVATQPSSEVVPLDAPSWVRPTRSARSRTSAIPAIPAALGCRG